MTYDFLNVSYEVRKSLAMPFLPLTFLDGFIIKGIMEVATFQSSFLHVCDADKMANIMIIKHRR